MRRILVVVGLVVLLAAAIVVPAVAQTPPDGSNPVDRVLSALGVHPGTEEASEAWRNLFSAPTANDVVISPIERNSSGGRIVASPVAAAPILTARTPAA